MCAMANSKSDLSLMFFLGRNARLLNNPDQFSNRADPELLHDATAMHLHRFFGHPKLAAYLLVQQPRSYEFHHFEFSRREPFK